MKPRNHITQHEHGISNSLNMMNFNLISAPHEMTLPFFGMECIDAAYA